MRKKIAIFASGAGTNAEKLVSYFSGNREIGVGLIVSNRREAVVLQRAAALGVPAVHVSKVEFDDSQRILEVLSSHQIDFIVLAGFLLKMPDYLIRAYADRIVNIHPALLPKFGGKGMYGDRVHEAVLEAGESETGITIHYINEHYDEGQILFQATCPVFGDDTPGQLAQRVHDLEYAHYAPVIEAVILKLEIPGLLK